MCLIAFAIHASPRWPLVIAANRDEFFDRPTLPLAAWQTQKGTTVVSGRDVRAGGTWLGTTPGGRVAFLTNVREIATPTQSYPFSRGALVMHWLDGDMNAEAFMARTDSRRYGGFNLVVGDWQTGNWTWLSNRSFAAGRSAPQFPGDGWCSRSLGPGVYGLSNAALNTPWPKTVALRAAVAGAVDPENGANKEAGLALDESELWSALASRTRAKPGELPQTGLPLALEEVLSSAFVDSSERAYGTRCSTLLVANRHSEMTSSMSRTTVRLEEKTYLPSRQGATHTDDRDVHIRVSQVLEWEPADQKLCE